jgi:hypothetical protein
MYHLKDQKKIKKKKGHKCSYCFMMYLKGSEWRKFSLLSSRTKLYFYVLILYIQATCVIHVAFYIVMGFYKGIEKMCAGKLSTNIMILYTKHVTPAQADRKVTHVFQF